MVLFFISEAFEIHAYGCETIDKTQFKHMCYMLYLSPTDRGIQQLFEEIDVNGEYETFGVFAVTSMLFNSYLSL